MKKKPSKTAKIFSLVGIFVFLVAAFFAVQHLLVPKYSIELPEGGMVREYYKDARKDFDVIFVGDCEVYEDYSPMVLWEDYGISSYIRGSSQQLIFQSYYMLEDTIRYEKPKVVVFSVRSLQYDYAWSEPYNRMTIEGMKWSSSKVNCIKASMLEDENFVDYVFPILRYHTRWKEVNYEDFHYYFKPKQITHNGYYMVLNVKPVENLPSVKPLADYTFPDRAWEYMDKMRTLCEDNGIELLLVKSASVYPHWYDEWDEQVEDYAKEHNLVYVNLLEHQDETRVNYETDTSDAGLHMNLYGAEKCSKYLGKVLKDNYDLKDRRDEEELSQYWKEKRALYDEAIDEQIEILSLSEE